MIQTELLVLLITWGNSKNVSPQSHLSFIFLSFFCRQNVYVMKPLGMKHPNFFFMNNVRHLTAEVFFSFS